MTSADFPHHRRGISPGKSAFFPPMPAVSTQRAITFRYSGHHNDVLAHPAHYASYTVPVRQDQSFPESFLLDLVKNCESVILWYFFKKIPASRRQANRRLRVHSMSRISPFGWSVLHKPK